MSNIPNPHEIPKREELCELILEALITTKIRDPFEEGLRPSEIKNAIINMRLLKLNQAQLYNLTTRLHRSLNDNMDDGFIKKDDKGHQKVYYKLVRKEFPQYEFINDAHIDIKLPPIFGLYGFLKKSKNFDEFKNIFKNYLMSELKEKLYDVWGQYQLVSKYSFVDWDNIYEVLESDETTLEEREEVMKLSKLMFEYQLYRRKILVLHGKEVDTIKQ